MDTYQDRSKEVDELGDVGMAENPEQRCPCVLLLDTSSSMSGAPISALNNGLRTLKASLSEDPMAARRVEIAVVTFSSTADIVQDFVTVDQFEPPSLAASGCTSMGQGIETALQLVEGRKKLYRENGITYYRPWVFMITDGAPTDCVEQAARRVRQGEEKKRLAFFAVGVEGADMGRLHSIAVRTPVKLLGLNFASMFEWLSGSLQRVSGSRPDDQVALPPVDGWGHG